MVIDLLEALTPLDAVNEIVGVTENVNDLTLISQDLVVVLQ